MLRNALDALAALSVPGVRANHPIDAVPPTLHRADLPALLVLPVDLPGLGTEGQLFGDRAGGFEALAFSEGPRTVRYAVTHLLLTDLGASGVGLRAHLPRLVGLIDAYFAALAHTVTLDGLLLEPAQVRVEPGIYPYNGARYVGCAFRHRWMLDAGAAP